MGVQGDVFSKLAPSAAHTKPLVTPFPLHTGNYLRHPTVAGAVAAGRSAVSASADCGSEHVRGVYLQGQRLLARLNHHLFSAPNATRYSGMCHGK